MPLADLRGGGGTGARTGPAWRTYQQVRAASRKADEAYSFCQPVAREDKARRLFALEAYATKLRRQKRANAGDWGPKGPLGDSAVKLGRLLIRFMAHLPAAGKRVLAPSREYLADALGIDPRTVDRAKEELRRHGWLAWIRRYEPVDDPGGEGPQIRQIPNAYRLTVPAAAVVLLGFHGMAAPVSADLASPRDQAAASDAAMRAHSRDQFRASLDASPALRKAAAAGEKLSMSAEDIRPRNRHDNR